MNKKCPNCHLVNFNDAAECKRCQYDLIEVSSIPGDKQKSFLQSKILRRAIVCAAVCLAVLCGFYLSLIFSSKSLSYDEKKSVYRAVEVLDEKGFAGEAFLLDYLTSYRADDNWLNASVVKENAYAATNFPFEIMTVYPDFFKYPVDETERAAILLHEAQHLKGADEKEAYEFVWKNRKKLGWTKDKYASSIIWQNVRRQTKEYAPNLFVCNLNEFGDCTE
jgi:hypothetical protein